MNAYVSTSSAIIEFAPQPQMQALLSRLAPAATIVATDLMDLRFANLAADGCALPHPDDCFDIIVSFHVLEHIPDDHLAMCEMARVLRAGGIILIQVPRRAGRPTEEDFDASPEEKARRFGQSDHVRYYGDDLEDRLERAGLETTFYTARDLYDPEQLQEWGIPHLNPIWICRTKR